MSFHARNCCALIALGLLAGCFGGAADEDVPPLEPVSGTVMLDGKPAEAVAVTFMPMSDTAGGGAYGKTDASGKYSLTYRNGEPGIPKGRYYVIFSKMVQADGSPIPEGKTAADVDAKNVIPPRYREKGEMPIFEVVVPGSAENFNFKLASR